MRISDGCGEENFVELIVSDKLMVNALSTNAITANFTFLRKQLFQFNCIHSFSLVLQCVIALRITVSST